VYDIYDECGNILGPMGRASNKQRTVRKNFSFPEEDLRLFEKIQTRCRKANRGLNDSELVRAGLTLLLAAPQEEFIYAIDSVVKLKPGKPKNSE
jgi:hypothetical protein